MALAAALIASCGGGSKGSDSEQVTAAVTGWAHAFGRGDGDKACSLLTPGARDAFVARVSSLVGTRDCAEAVTKLQSVAGPAVTGPFQDAKVTAVQVNGDSGSARLIAGGHAAQVPVEKRGGDWLLSHVPGL